MSYKTNAVILFKKTISVLLITQLVFPPSLLMAMDSGPLSDQPNQSFPSLLTRAKIVSDAQNRQNVKPLKALCPPPVQDPSGTPLSSSLSHPDIDEFTLNPLEDPVPPHNPSLTPGSDLNQTRGKTYREGNALELTAISHKTSSHPPLPSEAKLSPAVLAFLTSMDWTSQDLQNHTISPATLDQLLTVENSRLWNTLRWVSLDHWLTRVFHYPLLDFGGLGHNAESLKQHDMTGLSRFSMRGPSLPLQSSWTLTKALASGAFREGLQFGISKGLNLTLSALLVYQMAQPSDNIFAVYSSANTNSILALSSQFRTHPALFSLFAFPPAYGLLKGLLALRPFDKLSPPVLDQSHQALKERPPSVFNDYIRWFLPVYPLNNALTTLEAGLLWEGRTDKSSHKEREQAFAFIQTLVQQRQGMTQTQALSSLSRLAEGLHLNDIHHLKGAQEAETLLHLLSLKTRAFESLKNTPLDNRLSQLYRISYLWSLGYSPSFWKTSVPLAAINTGRLAAKILSFVAIIKTIMAYLDCPERPGLTFSGYQKWSSDFTQPCFDEFVRLFNTIPGQPASSLTAVIPQYHFPDGTYSLDLSGKGLEETVILDILKGFKRQHQIGQGPSLTGLNLSNNQFGSQTDNTTIALANLLTSFSDLTSLDLSNNQIGLNGIQGVQALTQSLNTLQSLKTFTILPSRTLSARMVSLFDSTKFQLTNHPDLLPQPPRLTTPDDVRVYFQTANLSTTAFDFSGKVTDDALGTTLTTLMKSLRDYNSLTMLDLSNNYIGLAGDAGTMALGQGLINLSSLQSFILNRNYMGLKGVQGIQALAQSITQGLPALKSFTILPSGSLLSPQMLGLLNFALTPHPNIPLLPILFPNAEAIQSFFLAVPPAPKALNFSGILIDDAQGTVLTILMQSLSPHTNTLTSLDLSNNQIGLSGDAGTVVLGDGLANLKALTFLDLRGSSIGLNGIQGVQALAKSLDALPFLKNVTILPSRTLSAKMVDLLHLNNNTLLLPQPARLTSLDDVRVYFQTAPLSTTTFDFTKKVTDDPQGQILSTLVNALKDYSSLTSLTLSNNFIGAQSDNGIINLGQRLTGLSSLSSLILSNNYIGYSSDWGATILSTNLANLPSLTHIDLSNNWFGYNSNKSLQVLAQTLKQGLPSLKTFTFLPSSNLLSPQLISIINLSLKNRPSVPLLSFLLADPDTVRLYFQAVTPARTALSFSGLLSDNAQRETLTTLMQSLSLYNQTLTYLDLSNNSNLGYTNDSGTVAIGNGLANLKSLTTLDLSYNRYLGLRSDSGTVAIGNSLRYLTSLTTLNLSHSGYLGLTGDSGVVAIGNGLASLKSLTMLDLSHNGYLGYWGDSGTVAIGNSLRYLTALTTLDLSNNQFLGNRGDSGTVAIGNGLASLKSLTTLDLSGTYLGRNGDSGTVAIGNSLRYLTALTTLDLSNNQFLGFWGDGGMEALAKAFKGLRSLKVFKILPSSGLSSKAIVSLNSGLTNYTHFPLLPIPLTDNAAIASYFSTVNRTESVFNFSGMITNDDAAGLTLTTLMSFLSQYNKTLTSLDLSHNSKIGFTSDSGTVAIGNGLANLKSLTTLDLSHNYNLGYTNDSGTVAIGNGLANLKSLTTLDLSNNQCLGYKSDSGVVSIGNGLASLKSLTTLDLSHNTFLGRQGDSGTVAIGNALANLTALTFLDLSNNGYLGWTGDSGTVAIGNGLSNLKALTFLDLSNNGYLGWTGDSGTVAIGNGLSNLKALTSLDLSHNSKIGFTSDSGTVAIGNGLASLKSLTTLDLSNNPYLGSKGTVGIEALIQGLYHLQFLKVFNIIPSNSLSPSTINQLTFAATYRPGTPTSSVLLRDKASVLAYFQTVSPFSSAFDFSRNLTDDASGETLSTLMQSLIPFQQTLITLNLNNNDIGSISDSGTQALGIGLANLTALTSLNLGYNSIGLTNDAGSISIAQSLASLPSLVSLNLGGNLIGKTGNRSIEAFVQSLNNSRPLKDFTIVPSSVLSAADITRLNLAATSRIVIPVSSVLLKDPEAVKAYFKTVTPLTSTFSFPGNLTDDASSATLTTFMQYLHTYNTSLTHLDLSHNQIGLYGDAGTQALGQGLVNFKALTHLDLSYNQLGSQSSNGSVILGQSLAKLPSLVSLNLGYNKIGSTGPEGSSAIVSAIPSMVNLQDLTLTGITNIQWDQNLVEINAFTNRKLQAVCQSQLCHGTAITSNKTLTSSASRLHTPLPFRVLNSALDGLGKLLFNSWNTLVDKMRESAREVTSDSPAYFPNINNPHMSDWQPNPLRNREQSEDYASLAPYVLQQSIGAYVSPPALSN